MPVVEVPEVPDRTATEAAPGVTGPGKPRSNVGIDLPVTGVGLPRGSNGRRVQPAGSPGVRPIDVPALSRGNEEALDMQGERTHLDIHDRSSRETHARQFGVTEDQLRKAVPLVGSRISTLRSHLKPMG